MAIESTWLENNLGLYRKFTGEIYVVDIVNDNLNLQQGPKFKTVRYIIDDYLNVTSDPFKTEQTKPIANVLRMRTNTKEYLKIAIISRDSAESKAVANGFCEQMKVCHYLCRVFHSLADAQVWVAIP